MVTVVTLMRGPTFSEHLLCAKVGVFPMYSSPAEGSPGLTQEALQKDPAVLPAYVNPALCEGSFCLGSRPPAVQTAWV